MNETSLTLLDRIQSAGSDQDWHLLEELYQPLLQAWAKRFQVQSDDVADLIQDVLVTVLRELPNFSHNGHAGAFRCWLRTILLNRVRNHWWQSKRHLAGEAVHQELQELEDEKSALSELWAEEHDRYLLQQLLKSVREDFSSQPWQAFLQTAVENKSPQQVAEALGISTNTVMVAKSRVLSKLREKARGMLDL